ncbi:MAG: hypothetical protein SO116_01645, partial [Treponema sp.]|nr:hypothetical protein [Treponema sp.]
TVCGKGTILFVAYATCNEVSRATCNEVPRATATNRAFLHPTSAPGAFCFKPPPGCTCPRAASSSKMLHIRAHCFSRVLVVEVKVFIYLQSPSRKKIRRNCCFQQNDGNIYSRTISEKQNEKQKVYDVQTIQKQEKGRYSGSVP